MSVFNTPEFRKPGFKLALIATILASIVILLGIVTRLLDAGLGCPGWPSCYGGQLLISEVGEIPSAGIEADKASLDMIHRFLAAALGLLIISLAVISWRQRDNENIPFRLPTLILFLVAWEVLFGMWTVTLSLWPLIVTVHMLAAMTMLSLLWVLTLRLDNKNWEMYSAPLKKVLRLKPWLFAAIVIITVQILLGAWTSSNYAAFACPDFPTCQNVWWPEMDLKNGFNLAQSIGPNYLGGMMESEARVAIHVIHRLGALMTSVYLLILCGLLLVIKDWRVRRMGLVIFVVLVLQLGLAVGNIALMVPLVTAITHNIGSALLLLTLVTLATRVWTAKPEYQRLES